MKPQRSRLAASIAVALWLTACSAPPETSRATSRTTPTNEPAGQAGEVMEAAPYADGVEPVAAAGPQALAMRNARPVSEDDVQRQAALPPSAAIEQAAKVKPSESSRSRPDRDAAAAPVATSAQIAQMTAADAMSVAASAPAQWPVAGANREHYEAPAASPVKQAASEPVSTFSIDVDTGAYSNLRRLISAGQLPPADAVRIEEMLNYFDYDYPSPAPGAAPFQVSTELAPAPWNAARQLLLIGIQGFDVAPEDVPASNLVFLIDTSGSMQSADKLGLVREAMIELAAQLRPQDRVAIVTYAGSAGLVLPPTRGDRRGDIIAALDQLQAGGSTNGGAGIELAYAIAAQNFVAGGVNRVVLCTDGDFNVGVTSHEELLKLIEAKAKSKVFLTALGFGMGNYKDDTLELLADKGNGNYGYVDSTREARKILVDGASGTLVTIAKDVKLQVEFNPRAVQSYRLLGYENRMLATRDFNDDKKDAGEIGAGHQVTVFYEIVPAGSDLASTEASDVAPLRYQTGNQPSADGSELLTVAIRYKPPTSDASIRFEQVVHNDFVPYGLASDDFRFGAAVAGVALKLRASTSLKGVSLASLRRIATTGVGEDRTGERAEFLGLVKMAEALNAS